MGKFQAGHWHKAVLLAAVTAVTVGEEELGQPLLSSGLGGHTVVMRQHSLSPEPGDTVPLVRGHSFLPSLSWAALALPFPSVSFGRASPNSPFLGKVGEVTSSHDLPFG